MVRRLSQGASERLAFAFASCDLARLTCVLLSLVLKEMVPGGTLIRGTLFHRGRGVLLVYRTGEEGRGSMAVVLEVSGGE